MYEKIATQNNSKILRQTKINFANIDKLIGEIIEKNALEDLDSVYKKSNIEKKKTTEETLKKNSVEQEKKTSSYLDPETKLYLSPAILPSSDYWNRIGQKTTEADKKMPKPFKEVTWYEPFSLLSLQEPKFPKINSYNFIKSASSDLKPCSKKQEFVKIGSYIFTVNTDILGLNQYNKSPVFFLVSPNNGYLHKVATKLSNQEYEEQRNQFGKIYLADAINCVKRKVPTHTKISCIVLGDRYLSYKDSFGNDKFEQENMDAYIESWLLVNQIKEENIEAQQNPDQNLNDYDLWRKVNKERDVQQNIQQKIDHYYLTKEASKAEIDIDVYNMHALQHKFDLNPEDLETVYKIARNIQKNDGAGEAIIVHCQQGLDRTGMLTFALILFANYEEFFTGKNCADKIYAAYKKLQWSRSPQALTKLADFVNAIYLAHALAAIDLEKKYRASLDNLIREDKGFRERNKTLVEQLDKAKSTVEFNSILDKELQELILMQNNNESNLTNNAPKKRPRSSSCTKDISAPVNTINSFKKSSSLPEHLLVTEIKTIEIDINKELQSTEGFFATKPSSELTDNGKEPRTNQSILTTIPESTAEALPEKIEKLEIKSQSSSDEGRSHKKPAGFFERKPKARNSDVIKKSTVANPPKNYQNEIAFYRDASEHRKNTEDALLNRIRSID